MLRWFDMKKLFILIAFFGVLFSASSVTAAEQVLADVAVGTTEAQVFMFGRDDCGFCQKQFAWLSEQDINYVYLNIVESEAAKTYYNRITEKHELTKVTPITVIGERVIVGYNGPDTTGRAIKEAVERRGETDIKTLDAHLDRAPKQDTTVGGGCGELGCTLGDETAFTFDLPLLGVVDLKSFSLFSLSALLGVIDGFNPCAMWVLITFLVILSQAGSRRKMIFLAGLFIVAEAVMYNLILNIWYKTWDFVALDQYVTPAVGVLALSGGLFFLWRWKKSKKTELVCDITNIETQSKTISKFQTIVSQPITIASIFAILLIAFSVNVIEFACSIGIPQAYTKILELNMLTFMERQWYIFVFTVGYMLDDFIVFGLAIWGYSKLQSHGGKYAQLSLLIGGVLMVLLGALLVVDPSLLVL